MTHTSMRADLSQFTGSEHWYRHPLNSRLRYTDGVRYLTDNGAAWLIDELALTQRHAAAVAAEPFQMWCLVVKPDRTAVLECSDGNGNTVFSKRIPFTDFPLVTIQLYLTDNTILLPSEY